MPGKLASSAVDVTIGNLSHLKMIDDPLMLGFVLMFCKIEHNTENIRFVISAKGFQDMMIAHDPLAWNKTFKELDEIYICKNFGMFNDVSATIPMLSQEEFSGINKETRILKSPSVFTLEETTNEMRVYLQECQNYPWASRVGRIDIDRAIRYIW